MDKNNAESDDQPCATHPAINNNKFTREGEQDSRVGGMILSAPARCKRAHSTRNNVGCCRAEVCSPILMLVGEAEPLTGIVPHPSVNLDPCLASTCCGWIRQSMATMEMDIVHVCAQAAGDVSDIGHGVFLSCFRFATVGGDEGIGKPRNPCLECEKKRLKVI